MTKGRSADFPIVCVGGITIAQQPDTADIPDMPASAIASGCVDFVLSPEAIALKIVEIAGHAGHQSN
jgi:chemotaxis response regulator CheB